MLSVSKGDITELLSEYITNNENGDKIFDFESILPIGDVEDQYHERIKKWGTNWDGYDLNITDYCVVFYTSWTPPIPIIKRLAELHKGIGFCLEYHEPGVGFRGRAKAKWKKNKVIVEDKYWDMTQEDYEELGYECTQ
jgi:hypothetical protein